MNVDDVVKQFQLKRQLLPETTRPRFQRKPPKQHYITTFTAFGRETERNTIIQKLEHHVNEAHLTMKYTREVRHRLEQFLERMRNKRTSTELWWQYFELFVELVGKQKETKA